VSCLGANHRIRRECSAARSLSRCHNQRWGALRWQRSSATWRTLSCTPFNLFVSLVLESQAWIRLARRMSNARPCATRGGVRWVRTWVPRHVPLIYFHTHCHSCLHRHHHASFSVPNIIIIITTTTATMHNSLLTAAIHHSQFTHITTHHHHEHASPPPPPHPTRTRRTSFRQRRSTLLLKQKHNLYSAQLSGQFQ
jgi:hypothetical protein